MAHLSLSLLEPQPLRTFVYEHPQFPSPQSFFFLDLKKNFLIRKETANPKMAKAIISCNIAFYLSN